MRWGSRYWPAAAAAAIAVLALVGGASGRGSDMPQTANWTNWGDTLDQNRYSPLTQITPGNVDQLGRVFTADLNRFVPGIKKGQQSYPVVVNGTMFVTSGDDQVFAVNGDDRRPALAVRARQPRHVQELRRSSRTAASRTATTGSSCSRST